MLDKFFDSPVFDPVCHGIDNPKATRLNLGTEDSPPALTQSDNCRDRNATQSFGRRFADDARLQPESLRSPGQIGAAKRRAIECQLMCELWGRRGDTVKRRNLRERREPPAERTKLAGTAGAFNDAR